jgi:hypothetical protein
VLSAFETKFLAALKLGDYRAALQLALDELPRTLSLVSDPELREAAREMLEGALDGVMAHTQAAATKQGALDANAVFGLVVVGRQLGIADAFVNAAAMPTAERIAIEARGLRPN